MDPDEYLRRFAALDSASARAALLEDVLAAERAAQDVADERGSGLLPVFSARSGKARFKQRQLFDEGDHNDDLMFAMPAEQRAVALAQPITVPDLDTFKHSFLRSFCSGGLQELDWSNVVAAGSAVVACAVPLPASLDSAQTQRVRSHFQEAFASSDVDLFLVGLRSKAEADAKLLKIYDSVCAATPFEVVCFRTAHAVTMVSQFPYRHVQVSLCLYASAFDVARSADVDACALVFDGRNVLATPRGHLALTSLRNTVDAARRSPSYEMRLAKYAARGFEVGVPGLARARLDPTVLSRPWGELRGLAKLVALEQLRTTALRWSPDDGVSDARQEKARVAASMFETEYFAWDAHSDAAAEVQRKRKEDVKLNTEGRPYNIHRCFFGTAAEVLHDCAPADPPLPLDMEASSLSAIVHGPLRWLGAEDFPARAERPWEVGAYLAPAIGAVCDAVGANDVDALRRLLDDAHDEWDNAQHDALGRSPLHVGLLAGADAAVTLLLDASAVDATLAMPDGRSALHLVALYDRVSVLPALAASLARTGAALSALAALRTADEQALTALDIAVLLGRVDVAAALLKDFGARASDGIVASVAGTLAWRAQGGLNEFGAPVPVPLVCAVPPHPNRAALVSLLLDHGGDDPAALTAYGTRSNVLHLCAHFGNASLLQSVMSALRERRAHESLRQLLAAPDANLRTPLQVAVAQGSLACAQLLWDALPQLDAAPKAQARLRVQVAEDDMRQGIGGELFGLDNHLLNVRARSTLLDACDALLLCCKDQLDPQGTSRVYQPSPGVGRIVHARGASTPASPELTAQRRQRRAEAEQVLDWVLLRAREVGSVSARTLEPTALGDVALRPKEQGPVYGPGAGAQSSVLKILHVLRERVNTDAALCAQATAERAAREAALETLTREVADAGIDAAYDAYVLRAVQLAHNEQEATYGSGDPPGNPAAELLVCVDAVVAALQDAGSGGRSVGRTAASRLRGAFTRGSSSSSASPQATASASADSAAAAAAATTRERLLRTVGESFCAPDLGGKLVRVAAPEQPRALALFRRAYAGDADAVLAALAATGPETWDPALLQDALGNTLAGLIAARAPQPATAVSALLGRAASLDTASHDDKETDEVPPSFARQVLCAHVLLLDAALTEMPTARLLRRLQPPAASNCSASLGELAVLRDDAELLDVVAAQAARLGEPMTATASLALQLDRSDVLRALLARAGRGVDWSRVIGALAPAPGRGRVVTKWRSALPAAPPRRAPATPLASALDPAAARPLRDCELPATWLQVVAAAPDCAGALQWLLQDGAAVSAAFDAAWRAAARGAAPELRAAAELARAALRRGSAQKAADAAAAEPGALLAGLAATGWFGRPSDAGAQALDIVRGWSLLGHAVAAGQCDNARAIVDAAGGGARERGALANAVCFLKEGMTPVHVAAANLDAAMLRLVLQELGADATAQTANAYRRNALHVMLVAWRGAATELSTPQTLSRACEVVAALEEAVGARGLRDLWTQQDGRGDTPLHLLLCRRDEFSAQSSIAVSCADAAARLLASAGVEEPGVDAAAVLLARDAAHRTVVHRLATELPSLSRDAQDRLQFVARAVGADAWREVMFSEDASGATPLDAFLRGGADASVLLFGDSALLDRVPDLGREARKGGRPTHAGRGKHGAVSRAPELARDGLATHPIFAWTESSAAAMLEHPRTPAPAERVYAHACAELLRRGEAQRRRHFDWHERRIDATLHASVKSAMHRALPGHVPKAIRDVLHGT